MLFMLYSSCLVVSIRGGRMRDADRIRMYGRERYVMPARHRRENRFSIRAGDVVRELKLAGRTPAVCSALRSRQFLQSNQLRLVTTDGPQSGQSTTMVYTYEFVETDEGAVPQKDAWSRLRGALKDVFAELGGGENYLQAERNSFYTSEEDH